MGYKMGQKIVHEHSCLGRLYGLSLNKSSIKNHAILFRLGQIVKLNQIKLDSTNPNKRNNLQQ